MRRTSKNNPGLKKNYPFFAAVIFWVSATLWNISCSSSTPPTTSSPNPYLVSGALTYTGSLGSVNNSHPVVIELNTTPAFRSSGGFFNQNTTNGGNYKLGFPGTGVYYLMALYQSGTPPCLQNWVDSFPAPHQGNPYFIYDGSSCGVSTPITVSAPATLSINVSLDDTCLFNGVSGSMTYSGTSTVSMGHGIVVALYTDAGYSTLDPVARQNLVCNYSSYNLGTLSSSTEYLQAFLDLAGTGVPAVGDPYIQYGAITPSPTLSVNLSFNDTNKF